MKILLLIAALLAWPLPALAQSRLAAGPSEFIFDDRRDGEALPIEIAAVAGKGCALRPCDLVIAMPGLTRNALQTRDNWLELADGHDLVVVAPYIDARRFPTRMYQQGGILSEPDRSKWLYATIERLYAAMVARGVAKPDGYVLFGHSAGAQFVHRMVLAMPEARFRLAIVANAGFYTLPTDAGPAGGFDYPFSLAGAPTTSAERRQALGRRLELMLGDQDNDPNHHQLNNSKGAKAQGPHRFARGQFFFAAAEAEAKRLGTPFGWRLTVVPGVDHDNTRMAAVAARLIFGAK